MGIPTISADDECTVVVDVQAYRTVIAAYRGDATREAVRNFYTHTDPLSADPLLGAHVLLDRIPTADELRGPIWWIDADGKVSVECIPQADGSALVDLIAEPTEAIASKVDCDPIGSDVDGE